MVHVPVAVEQVSLEGLTGQLLKGEKGVCVCGWVCMCVYREG